jgi:epoxyqueuosine reductase
MRAETVKRLAAECGFELAGIAPAEPSPDFARYQAWLAAGMAGEMAYLAGRRGEMRADPRSRLPAAHSIICVGKLYNTASAPAGTSGISRHARGEDYHRVMQRGLKRLVELLKQAGAGAFDWKTSVDTAPLLERSYARRAGLGWIGKNTCLIREGFGSWFVLGEVLVSLELEPDHPPPDRCGKCTRCIDACPTRALIPTEPGCFLDARRCISYLTIERRGAAPEDLRAQMGAWVFGCDVCQAACPWNRRAPVTSDPAFCGPAAAPAPTSFTAS